MEDQAGSEAPDNGSFTALRRERQPLGIDRPRLGMVEQLAQVQEVLLRGGSLSSARHPPFVNEGSGIHDSDSRELCRAREWSLHRPESGAVRGMSITVKSHPFRSTA